MDPREANWMPNDTTLELRFCVPPTREFGRRAVSLGLLFCVIGKRICLTNSKT